MSALVALSERKHVSYDLLQGLSTVDILYAENKKKKWNFMFLFFPSRKNFRRHFYFVLILQTSFFPREFTVKPSLYY